jgi:hypothetical protein
LIRIAKRLIRHVATPRCRLAIRPIDRLGKRKHAHRCASVLLVTGKATKLGGGVLGDNFEAARHRQLLNAQMPDRRPVRVSAEESDPQQTVKIYHRWYHSVKPQIVQTTISSSAKAN